MRSSAIKSVLSGVFLALALALPFLTAGNPQLGNVFLLMHIPVLLCGFLCGGNWGLLCGFLAPLIRSLLFGAPKLFPTACSMALELAVYGLVCGWLYNRLPQKPFNLYICLAGALLLGRAASGIASAFFYGMAGVPYSFEIFMTAAFVTALPGIAIQFVLVPPITLITEKCITKSR